MDVVVSEELRGRSRHGRDIIELEDALGAMDDVEREQRAWQDACANAARRVAELACRKVTLAHRRRESLDMDVLAKALADPNVMPGKHTAAIVQVAMSEKAKGKRPMTQSSASEFLSRPYYEHGRNRFLFSCADEPDGCARNPSTAWQYTLD